MYGFYVFGLNLNEISRLKGLKIEKSSVTKNPCSIQGVREVTLLLYLLIKIIDQAV